MGAGAGAEQGREADAWLEGHQAEAIQMPSGLVFSGEQEPGAQVYGKG